MDLNNGDEIKIPNILQDIHSKNKAFLSKALLLAHILQIRRTISVSVFCGLIAHGKLNEHALQMRPDIILIYLRLLIGLISEQGFQLAFNAYFIIVFERVRYVAHEREYLRHRYFIFDID